MTSSEIHENVQQLVNNFDQDSFIYDLLRAYGISKTSITRLQKGDFNLAKNDDEILFKKKLFFKETNSKELMALVEDLSKEENLKHNPRFVITTNYKRIVAKDTRTGKNLNVELKDLPKNHTFFLPWAGQEVYQASNEIEADRKASYSMAKLYDILIEENPDILEKGIHELNLFFSRLLFCFFAEDTGIFPVDDMFTNTLMQHTQKDGTDVHLFLDKLFIALNNKDNSKEAKYISDFPYVNGGLFKDKIRIPKFNKEARYILEKSGDLDWSHINPDIFGSMIQAVVNPDQRGNLGMHYTSVPNIMKVIKPLFLDDLYEELESAKGNPKKLRELLQRIGKLKIFDPACGSGNFLIIAYKELRKLEIQIITEIIEFSSRSVQDSQSKIHFLKDGYKVIRDAQQSKLNFQDAQTEIWFTNISLTQFYGIEIDDFAHEIAKLSLWLAEHQMNKYFESQLAQGKSNPILPLKASGNVIHANATRVDWEKVCPKAKDDEIYLLGNPPYLGSSNQDKDQKDDLKIIFKGFNNYKNLDYISCWFKKGTDYILNSNSKLSFVSTNSIIQGEQVALLWPYILDKAEIAFAYKSFKWTNSAKGNAGVTVTILGLRNFSNKQKYLFENDLFKTAKNINPYLIDAPNILVKRLSRNINGFPPLVRGSMPTDGGNFEINEDEKKYLLKKHPESKILIKKLMSGGDFMKGAYRWCLWIKDKDIELANSIPLIQEKLESVKQFRLKSKAPTTVEYAKHSNRFRQISYKETDCIVVPLTSSVRRKYIPFGFENENTVMTNSAGVIYDADFWLFGILSSKIHMVWVSVTCGRLKTDYRYSSHLSYNTFPFPEISKVKKANIEENVFAVLEEREKHPEKTMAELYDPDKMPAGLRQAHKDLDEAVERCYRLQPFENDTQRLEYLFREYEKMVDKDTLFEKRKKRRKK